MASMLSIFILYITNKCLVTGGLYNAALFKPAFMSSFLPGTPWTANRANDGNDYPLFNGGSCIHTDMDNPGWWMVDLRGLYNVEQIAIVNRGDDYGTSCRTKNFVFDIFETDPRLSRDFPMKAGQVCYTRTDPVGQGATLTQNCTRPILGRFVRFIRYTSDVINICEIKVMASYVTLIQGSFAVTPNAVLQVASFMTTYTDSSSVCTLLCQQYRDSDTCTAVNWVRTTKQCQMLKVDPRNFPSLTLNSNADFSIEA